MVALPRNLRNLKNWKNSKIMSYYAENHNQTVLIVFSHNLRSGVPYGRITKKFLRKLKNWKNLKIMSYYAENHYQTILVVFSHNLRRGVPYGRITNIFLKKLKKETFFRNLIFYAVDGPTATLRSPTGHEVEVWVSEYPYLHPPRVSGGGPTTITRDR